MKLISIRFLGKTQLLTENTAIDLANQLAAKNIRPDFSDSGVPDKAFMLFYAILIVSVSYLIGFYK